MTEIRIQRCLGRGGFGEVYKGLMSRPGGVEVDVAIKVLRGDLEPESQGIQRLRDEGRLLGRLTHPTILRVYDLVFIDGRAALVSEYVAGADLGRLLREDRVPPRSAFEVIAQVAAALDAAWSWPSVSDGKPLHLVHRDIKPDNIRIDPHGVVKLLDFGIAQAQTVQREAQTSVNTIMGSTQYLAPERLVQQEVGPEADVFALGCTLFEVLTGEALFSRRSMRQMYLLMVNEERFEQFLAERCGAFRERLVNDRAIALVRAMTTWRKMARPTAAEVAARCDAISDSIEGPTLTQWCRQRPWPPMPDIAGPLDGQAFGVGNEGAEVLAGPVSAAQRIVRPEPLPTPQSVQAMPPLDGDQVSRSMKAAGGPVPWSADEVVAVFPHDRTASGWRRVPQLDRQWPTPPKATARPSAPPRPRTPEPAPERPDPEASVATQGHPNGAFTNGLGSAIGSAPLTAATPTSAPPRPSPSTPADPAPAPSLPQGSVPQRSVPPPPSVDAVEDAPTVSARTPPVPPLVTRELPPQPPADHTETPAFPSIPPETMESLLPPGGLRGPRPKEPAPVAAAAALPDAPDEWVEAPTVRISRDAVLDDAALSEPTATSRIADLAALAAPARADAQPTLIQSATPAPARRRHKSSPPKSAAQSAEVRAAGLRFVSSLFGLAIGTIVLLFVIVLVVLMG